MAGKVIYVEVRHFDFWWGVYGLAEKTGWEDVIMYVKKGKGFSKIEYMCLCTKSYLRNGLKSLENDSDEKEFAERIRKFIDNDEIMYHYYYDSVQDEDFYEVPFEAERNQHNIKPRSIEMWYPSQRIDYNVLEQSVKAFLKKFLDMDVLKIEYKDIVSEKDALESYIETIEQWANCKGITFSDELVQQLEDEWGKPQDKVLEILKSSII